MADAGYSTPPGIDLRPPHPSDALAVAQLAEAVFGPGPDRSDLSAVARRFTHAIERCHPGSRLAYDGQGELVGATIFSPRGGLLVLSLAIVDEHLQGRGVGRAMLEHFPAARAGRNRVVMSSLDPKALRRYTKLGLAVRPCLSACGILRPGAVMAPAGAEQCSPLEGAAVVDALAREARGEAYGDDIRMWETSGDTLHLVGEEGAAVRQGGVIRILVARDERAAIRVLRAALAGVPPGETVHLRHVREGQDWALRTAVQAGLPLSPDGPLFSDEPLGRFHLPTGSVF
ncbi:MAG: GNAT family N-acetyltransferase [Solirubrobacteraceae bacterium]|nr:GNAT family N-acetyltransferase [Solirubrobacteraceae bacterium]